MNLRHLSRPMALTAAFILLTAGAHGDLITPDSIPNPPAAVASANGTYIPSAGNLVATQYAVLGLNFFNSGLSLTAITTLNGVKVWAPATRVASPPFFKNPPVAAISYPGTWAGGSFVLPGTTNPATVSSVSVEIVGQQGAGVSVSYTGSSGVAIPASLQVSTGPHGGTLYTFPGSGIRSFSVFEPILDPPGPGISASNPAWGVAEIAFAQSTAPEPGSLLLAGLGALGLTIRSWRKAL